MQDKYLRREVIIMNDYQEMQQKHQKEVNDFPMFFAFNQEQFKEGMKSLGLKPTQTYKVCSLIAGGVCRKEDAKLFTEMLLRQHRERRNALMTDDKFLSDALNYELSNHEFVVTGDALDALLALDLSYKDIQKDERLYNALQIACKEQREWYSKFG